MPFTYVLIPSDPTFAPTTRQLFQFASAVQAAGYLPEPPNWVLTLPTMERRQIINPFTRKPAEVTTRKRVELDGIESLVDHPDAQGGYRLSAYGDSVPRVPIVKMFDPDGADITARCHLGLVAFVNEPDAQVMITKSVGSRRFFIQIDWGKFARPKLLSGETRIAPSILNAAERIFGVSFIEESEYLDD